MRDQRDPKVLGAQILDLGAKARLYEPDMPASRVYDVLVVRRNCPDFDGGSLMSNDPAEHHSKTKQDEALESDGGA